MRKLRWDKADQRIPDPARVIDVPEDLSNPERTTRAVDRPTREERHQRSESHDQNLIHRAALRRALAKLSAGEELTGWDRAALNDAAPRGL